MHPKGLAAAAPAATEQRSSVAWLGGNGSGSGQEAATGAEQGTEEE